VKQGEHISNFTEERSQGFALERQPRPRKGLVEQSGFASISKELTRADSDRLARHDCNSRFTGFHKLSPRGQKAIQYARFQEDAFLRRLHTTIHLNSLTGPFEFPRAILKACIQETTWKLNLTNISRPNRRIDI